MKVIFLDIDGVLNLRNRTRDKYGSIFHKKFVDNLAFIIEKTEAKIVITSTWRYAGLNEMQAMWKSRKLPGEVIGITEHFQHNSFNVPRGCEIEEWLKVHGNFQRINWSKDEQQKCLDKAIVKNYVILDDDSDMLYGQREHYVRTSSQWDEKDAIEGYGLTFRAAVQAMLILTSDLMKLYYETK